MNDIIKVTSSDEGVMTVSSRIVAQDFEKQHQHVLRDIDTLTQSVQNWTHLFIPSEYTDSRGRKQREFLLTRDGFCLLAMGFTGERALEWKMKYIDVFNKLEAAWNSPEMVKNRALRLMESDIRLLQQTNTELEERIAELEPDAAYTRHILKNPGIVTATSIAKDYGMAAKSFNALLHGLGIQYRQGTQWFLYAKYQGYGYTHSKLVEITRSDGSPDTKPNTQWTQKGRYFLYHILKKNGILPMIEREQLMIV